MFRTVRLWNSRSSNVGIAKGARSSVLAGMSERPPIFTIGHSTRSIAELAELLHVGRADLVVDVRTIARSRHNPQYNEDLLPGELAPYRIGYQRLKDLGGLRARSQTVPASLNGFWKNQSFHNYADYALSDQFAAAIDGLLELSSGRRCAIMCAEAVWWRCHRRIIADYLLMKQRVVLHLMGDDQISPAQLTSAAKIEAGKIHYPAGQ